MKLARAESYAQGAQALLGCELMPGNGIVLWHHVFSTITNDLPSVCCWHISACGESRKPTQTGRTIYSEADVQRLK